MQVVLVAINGEQIVLSNVKQVEVYNTVTRYKFDSMMTNVNYFLDKCTSSKVLCTVDISDKYNHYLVITNKFIKNSLIR